MDAFFLLLTIIAESTAVVFMKLSNGFQHKLYATVAVVSYVLSFVFLTYALKFLPVGLANAIWAGASTVVVVLLGIFIFREKVSGLQLLFLSLIVIGLVGLNLSKSAG